MILKWNSRYLKTNFILIIYDYNIQEDEKKKQQTIANRSKLRANAREFRPSGSLGNSKKMSPKYKKKCNQNGKIYIDSDKYIIYLFNKYDITN